MEKHTKGLWNIFLKTEKSITETYDVLKTTAGDKYLNLSNVLIRPNKFENDSESVDGDFQFGRPSTSINNENISRIPN